LTRWQRVIVRTAANELDLSVLLVEQHVRMALGIADSACVISHGRLTTEGSAGDVADQIDAIEASYPGGTG
jgi:branched-chain amino acid transport system ATP-binding protein